MARTKAKLAANERATLALVNKIREATGRKPIQQLQRAFPQDSVACAIAKPLKVIKGMKNVANHQPDETPQNWPTKYATFTFSDEKTARIVARAINQPMRAYRDNDDDPVSEWDVRLPVYASEFIDDFDEGLYPHLVSHKAHPSRAFGA